MFTPDKVIVNIGNGNLNKHIKLNRLLINIDGYKSVVDVSYGNVYWKPIDNRFKIILMILGGLLILLIVSISLYIYLINVSLPYILMVSFNALFIFSVIQFLLTILPIKYFYKPYIGHICNGLSV